MISSNLVFHEEVPVISRLAELDLKTTALRTAVMCGMRFLLECTKLDPPYVRGIVPSGKMVRSLREQLTPSGWRFSNDQNYALTIHPKGLFSIAVAAGDAHTGLFDKNPSTRSEKGSATIEAVGRNQRAFSDISSEFPETNTSGGKGHTWLLLHYRDEDEVRLELSRPEAVGEDGIIRVWRERIVLPAISLTAPDFLKAEGSGVDLSPEIEVPIARKA